MSTWRNETFPSGTQIVSRWGERRPHFYVYGPVRPGEDEGTQMRSRHRMCQELAAWLNGGAVPTWLAGMARSPVSDIQIVDNELRSIHATGPYVDARTGRGDWKQDDAPEWVAERRYMIAQLLRGERP